MLISARPNLERLEDARQAFNNAPGLKQVVASAPYYEYKGVVHPVISEVGTRLGFPYKFTEFGLVAGSVKNGGFLKIIPPGNRMIGVPAIPEDIVSKTSKKRLGSEGYAALKIFLLESDKDGRAEFSIFGEDPSGNNIKRMSLPTPETAERLIQVVSGVVIAKSVQALAANKSTLPSFE